MRGKLKTEYFERRIGEIAEDLRATWEVLGEVIKGRNSGGEGCLCAATLRRRGASY